MTKKKSAAKPPAPKANPADQVLAWIVEGHTLPMVREAARSKCDKGLGLTPKQTDGAIAEALQRLEASADMDTVAVRGWCIEAYRLLYRLLREMGDFASAIRAVDRIWAAANELEELEG